MDSFDLSRPKKNISRDFSDGQLIAEIIYHYLPKVVNLHSFVKANSAKNKRSNWNMLKTRVFPKMGFLANNSDIEEVINCKKLAVENFLSVLRGKLENTEKVDLFATVNQPLKEVRVKAAKTMLPRMGTFTALENDDDGENPRQKELKEVLKLKDKIEDLEDIMLEMRKKLRYKNDQFKMLEEKFRQSEIDM